MHISTLMKYATLTLGILLSGCAQQPGNKQGDEAPRLLKISEKVDGKQVERLVWENAQSFGPIPARLAEKAERTCTALNSEQRHWRATGYHAKARDVDGKQLPGGGFFCASHRP